MILFSVDKITVVQSQHVQIHRGRQTVILKDERVNSWRTKSEPSPSQRERSVSPMVVCLSWVNTD